MEKTDTIDQTITVDFQCDNSILYFLVFRESSFIKINIQFCRFFGEPPKRLVTFSIYIISALRVSTIKRHLFLVGLIAITSLTKKRKRIKKKVSCCLNLIHKSLKRQSCNATRCTFSCLSLLSFYANTDVASADAQVAKQCSQTIGHSKE